MPTNKDVTMEGADDATANPTATENEAPGSTPMEIDEDSS